MGEREDQRLLRAEPHLDRIETALKLAAAKYALNDDHDKDLVPTPQIIEAYRAMKALWLLAGMTDAAPGLVNLPAVTRTGDEFRGGCWMLIDGIGDLRAFLGGGREDLAQLILPRIFKLVSGLARSCSGLKESNALRASKARTGERTAAK